jgi:hypothetical protein
MAFYAGKNASIVIGAVAYPMDTWTLDDTCEEIDCTNFTSGGVRQLIAGIVAGTMSASGPYTGLTPTAGLTGTIIFDVGGGGGTATRTILLTSVKKNTAVKDKATLEISGSITA